MKAKKYLALILAIVLVVTSFTVHARYVWDDLPYTSMEDTWSWDTAPDGPNSWDWELYPDGPTDWEWDYYPDEPSDWDWYPPENVTPPAIIEPPVNRPPPVVTPPAISRPPADRYEPSRPPAPPLRPAPAPSPLSPGFTANTTFIAVQYSDGWGQGTRSYMPGVEILLSNPQTAVTDSSGRATLSINIQPQREVTAIITAPYGYQVYGFAPGSGAMISITNPSRFANINITDLVSSAGSSITLDIRPGGGTIAADVIDVTVPVAPITLDGVVDIATGLQYVAFNAPTLSEDDISRAMMELFAEEAIGRIASVVVEGSGVVISRDTIQPLEALALGAREEMYDLFDQLGHEARRPLSANVSFIVVDTADVAITVEPSSNEAAVQHVRVLTPYYEVTLPPNFIASEVANANLYIDVDTANSQYTVDFSRPIDRPINLSVTPLNIISNYQTLAGIAVIAPSRLNPATGKLTALVGMGGNYRVIENRVDFGDIQGLDARTQQAIRTLASQGVIAGTGNGNFSPGNAITRGQMAGIAMHVLGERSPNIPARFADVRPDSSLFGAIGAAQNSGLMIGTSANLFEPNLVIPRDQLTALSARILRERRGFVNPANPDNYLSHIADRSSLALWSLSDLALASREGLIMLDTSGMFTPTASMTRGDAARVMYQVHRIF